MSRSTQARSAAHGGGAATAEMLMRYQSEPRSCCRISSAFRLRPPDERVYACVQPPGSWAGIAFLPHVAQREVSEIDLAGIDSGHVWSFSGSRRLPAPSRAKA